MCTTDSGFQLLSLNNVLYIFGAAANLISQGQMQREGYSLSITNCGIQITQTRISAKLVANNLYIIDTLLIDRTSANIADLSLPTLSSINDVTVKM